MGVSQFNLFYHSMHFSSFSFRVPTSFDNYTVRILGTPSFKELGVLFAFQGSFAPKYHHHHHHHRRTSSNLQWFSNERIMGYSDVLKAQSAIASITSCYKTNGIRMSCVQIKVQINVWSGITLCLVTTLCSVSSVGPLTAIHRRLITFFRNKFSRLSQARTSC